MTVQDKAGSIRITFVSKKGETISNVNPAATDTAADECVTQLMTLLTEQTASVARNRRAVFVA